MKKRGLALLLAILTVFVMVGSDMELPVSASQNPGNADSVIRMETEETDQDPADGDKDADDGDDRDPDDGDDSYGSDDGSYDPGDGSYDPGAGGNMPQAEITDLKAVYDAERDMITLSYHFSYCAYVRIYVNGRVDAEKYTGEVYDFDNPEEGAVYHFRVVAYNTANQPGQEAEVSCSVPYKKAVVTDVDADYNLEKGALIIDWNAANVAKANVYQDNVLLAEGVTSDIYLTEMKLEPLSRHTYKIVPYNKAGEEGTAGEYELLVDDYVARVDVLYADYNENTNQVTAKWETTYSKYVSVNLNGEVIVDKYTADNFSFSCELQPGASYILEVVPYNYKDQEGDSEEDDISYGVFDVPDEPTVKRVSENIRDKKGHYTGFAKPAVSVSWEAQKNAIYEIYRADQDKQSAYSWIKTVTAKQSGIYTYLDSKAEIGTYYYKIRRKIAEDLYIDQELFTALSSQGEVKISVPAPAVRAVLLSGGRIQLSLSADKPYVTGYEIYRKEGSGKYKKTAVITGNEYTDTDTEFGITYSYRVKAYYFDASSGRKYKGKYSKTAKVKNKIGSMTAEAVQISSEKIRLTWTPAANAEGYEVYFKSGTPGDSYALWTTTDKLTLTRKVNGSGKYSFLVKAYRSTKKSKSYFSSVEISCRAGFSAPGGFHVEKTTYSQNKTTRELIQKDRLAWNRVYGAEGYYIEIFNEQTKKYTRLADVKKGSVTHYTVSNPVTSGAKSIRYRIRAYDENGTKTGNSLDITPALGTVQKVKAVKSGKKVKISWKKTVAAERYQVYRSNGRNMVLLGETAKTSFTDQGVQPGVAYGYYVQAVNLTKKLVGAKSEQTAYRILPDDVSGLKAAKGNSGDVTITWKKTKQAQSYVIYCSSSKDGVYKKIGQTDKGVTSFVYKKQQPGTVCYYKVTAVEKISGDADNESAGKIIKVKQNHTGADPV